MMSPVEVTRKDRVVELDVLRGLAAVAVVLFHYTVRYDKLFGYATPPLVRVPVGFYGVEVFFCISGFVIFMTLDRTRRSMDFVVSRASRLWPTFIAAIVITFSVVHLFGLEGRQATGLQAFVNITMFPGLLHVPFVDGVYGSLQVELIFYCWMLAAFSWGMLKHVRLMLWLSLLPPVIFFLSHRFLGRHPPYLLGTFLLIDYIPFFAIGMAAYNMRTERGFPAKDLLLMLAAIGVTAICASVADAAVALFSTLVFCLIAWGRLGTIARAPLIFLGTISYPLYLLHQNIGYIIIRGSLGHGLSTNLAIVVAATVSIGLAAAVTWTVEKPARAWIRAAYERDRAPGGSGRGGPARKARTLMSKFFTHRRSEV